MKENGFFGMMSLIVTFHSGMNCMDSSMMNEIGILDTVTPLKVSLLANAFNAIIDPLLIFNCGMGVTGAAIATLGAEIISAGIFTYIMLKKKLIRWSKLLRFPKWSTLKPLLQGGAALQLRNLALNIAFLSVARTTQSIDNTGVAAAAHSIAIQVIYTQL